MLIVWFVLGVVCGSVFVAFSAPEEILKMREFFSRMYLTVQNSLMDVLMRIKSALNK